MKKSNTVSLVECGKYRSYAARFAAKEAMYKALSPFIKDEYNYTDYEVIKDEKGKPIAKFNGKLAKIKEIQNIKHHDLSLSHEGEYAIATYICEM